MLLHVYIIFLGTIGNARLAFSVGRLKFIRLSLATESNWYTGVFQMIFYTYCFVYSFWVFLAVRKDVARLFFK